VARRPSLRQLEYLLAIADCRHFGHAARKASVSQPTLSLQLQSLEDCLGTELVDRVRNNVDLTPAGQLVVERAREILLQVDELMVAVNQETKNLGGLIRLGTAPTVGPYILPRIIPRLHASYPALRIYIREELPSRLEELLTRGDIDLALLALPTDDHRLTVCELADEKLLIGLNRDHPLARLKLIPPQRLAGEKFLTLGRGHRLYEAVDRLADRHGAEVLRDYEGTSLDAVRQMVALGMGLSVFPAHYAASEIRKDPSVTLKSLRGENLKRSIGFVWRNSSVRAPQFNRLADLARLALRETDPPAHN